jgi:heme-degrading monooxygenase HmoA
VIFEDGIPTCDAVLVYLTVNSIESKMVKKEIDSALIENMAENGIAFIPYVDDGNIRGQLRADIRALQCLEWNQGNYLQLLPKIYRKCKMISRIWHGWTTIENADIYEHLLKTDIFPAIAAKNVSGYRGIQLLRRQLDDEVEFITIMQFDSIEAVKQFAGEDYEKSYVPEKARKVLSRHDERSQHYEIKESITY